MSVDVSKISKLGFGLMRLPEKNGEIGAGNEESPGGALSKGFLLFGY